MITKDEYEKLKDNTKGKKGFILILVLTFLIGFGMIGRHKRRTPNIYFGGYDYVNIYAKG